MLRRVLAIALALTLLPAAVFGCQNKVSVQTGERITCRYGDVIKDTVHTVKVPAAEAHLYSVKTSYGLCDRHAKLTALYQEAEGNIASNKLSAAQTLLQRVVASDPKFGQASSQLVQLRQGKTPTPDNSIKAASPTNGGKTSGSTGTGSSTPKPAGGDQPVGPTLNLAAWAPAVLDGFTTRTTASDPLALSRDYVPVSRGDVEAVVISVEQFSGNKMASAGLSEQMRHYDQNRDSVTVAGRASVFGTDGHQFAALGFVNGAMLVIVEGHTQPGVQPKALHDELVAVAKQLPVK